MSTGACSRLPGGTEAW